MNLGYHSNMRNFVIMLDDEFITSNIADSILLKEELNLFYQGDSQNKYFKLKTRTIKNDKVHSLHMLLEDGKEIFVSKSEAKAIVTLWNMSMMGYTFTRLLEFEAQQTLESWTYALEEYGYLQLKHKKGEE